MWFWKHPKVISAFASCWHPIHQWVNILPSLPEHGFILMAAKPRLSKNDVEMLVNPFITLSLDYCDSPCAGLVNYVIYRMQLKGVRRPRSFLAFCHLSVFRTINSILVSVIHKILHWFWSCFTHTNGASEMWFHSACLMDFSFTKLWSLRKTSIWKLLICPTGLRWIYS